MRRSNNTSKSFTDMLFNMLMAFFMLLMLAIVMINPKSKNKDIELKAEVIITMEWPDGNKDDMDLMVKIPQGQIVFYGRRDVSAANLDRDDRGGIHDRVQMEDGSTFLIQENWEHVTLRKLFPGEYIVNVHVFNKRDFGSTPVTIKVEKLNPRHSIIFSKTIDLYDRGEERTYIRFTVNGRGDIINLDDTEENFGIQLRGPG